jgi:hypothetical protein
VAGDRQAKASAKLALGLPPPARVIVIPPPQALAAGTETSAPVTAVVLDRAGLGLAGLAVSITANGALLPSAAYRGNGRYETRYAAPPTYPPGGLVQLEVTATDRAGKTVTGGANWQLEAPPVPRTVTARVVPSPVPADGRTAARVVLDVRDAAGMPVAHAQLIAVASHGTVGKLVPAGNGLYETTYLAPSGLPDGRSVLRVVDRSGFETSVPLALRETPRRVLVGVGAGYVRSAGDAAGPRFTADVWVPFRLRGATFGAGLSASYGTAERTVADATGAVESVSRATFLPVSLRLGYELFAGRRLSVTAGAGAVAGVVRFESSLSRGAVDALGVGATAFLSAARAVGPGHVFAEASYSVLEVRAADYRIEPGGPAVVLGYRLGVL